jgi:hypothetical protein
MTHVAPVVEWPEGKAFAFTVFDDPDSQTAEDARIVYGFLADLGLRTTKGVWPLGPRRQASDHGATCDDVTFRRWLQCLQQQGYEIGFHNATSHTSYRDETREGLERFREYFGAYPSSMANHYFSGEGIYFGDARLTRWRRLVYNALTIGRHRNEYSGHVQGHACYWGDLCRQHIRYVRNFTFRAINTLAVCPWMPYHDPARPFVNGWFASSEGSNVKSFLDLLAEKHQDALEAQRGACIVYAHFGHGFVESGTLSARFRELMQRLARKNGWFVPVSKLLDHLRQGRDPVVIGDRERASLEWRWLATKVRHGTS